MGEFLRRLKERKFVQWALAYVAGVFALLPSVDSIARRFGRRSEFVAWLEKAL